MLTQYHDAPSNQVENAKRRISTYKEEVNKYETAAKEQERKLNQLQKDKGLF